jgi:hypothetical protein
LWCSDIPELRAMPAGEPCAIPEPHAEQQQVVASDRRYPGRRPDDHHPATPPRY